MLEPVRFSTYHGGAREEGLLDFSASLNPYLPEWTGEMFERAKSISNRYPYYRELEEELSKLVGEPVTVTAGITEAIYLIGILALKGRKVIIPRHTYGEYERVTKIFGAEVISGPNDPEKLAELVENESIVFFCNPNNPDGKFYSPKGLRPLLDAVEDKGALLILDEAFIDFVKGAKSPEGENLVKLRTFTKSYGLPGIRVGYVIGFEEAFKSVRMPWSIGSLGYAFLEFLIEDGFEHLKKTMPLIWREKERMEKALNIKSDANFFIKRVGNGKAVVEALKRRGIAVRDCTSFGLPQYVRFSVRKREENERLIEAFRELGL
ncbi:aminotransferase class I/II-fold pyridoxal phosphate-dependent enzyme [Thermococcus sp. GR7]|uniref:aminotransferase class I/II-fold pyridoxal phosphate-dependent enzyme n=1 Tax=unclassified Thermococcus TaxID=2627626 RepID=UPI001431FD18|nr:MULTISPECIES: aminotransferase class I/II-fold pyridoxal phosphate-dependent enzyme [unclassified Thermococcus]NJE47305.1 aminotransferase class I/II-fold pyridoxal phosphate-dependent enzyme [Thermococcus sp. GR7]NJE78670.1 aminotransferase class I/II-fold pyridoxal phosphate-dependent enzyme [Thermococcus sp. GR4]NJF23205.1 aminotransferase class I/II-fold pyridoxal phosphate-dependent enzyme [Thermococcus sp. GR5]